MTTKQHITSIKNIFTDIKSLVEIQCGSGYDIENCEALQDKNLGYVGIDVVDEVIYDNRQYFRYEKNKVFMTLDASNEPIPKADLVVCTGMAPYLPISNIWSLLENIRESEARYFAFDYHHAEIDDQRINSEISLADSNDELKNPKKKENDQKPIKRAVNLDLAPFYFPKPKILIPSDDLSYSIALYKITDVGFFMDWYNDDISKLRRLLVDKIEEDAKTLRSSFTKELNGEAMFKEMLSKFLEIPPADHNTKYCYEEPYKTIINRIPNGLNIRHNLFRLVHCCELEQLVPDYPFVTRDNFIHSQIITKDYIRWMLNLSLFVTEYED